MPGLSFLFKKPWHPARLDNQKTVFIKESTAKSRLEREAEAAKEVAKEEELRSYERVGDLAERDPRTSSLRFMYSQPKKSVDSDTSHNSSASAPPPLVMGTGEDDDDVRKFWMRMKSGPDGESASGAAPLPEYSEPGSYASESAIKILVRKQSALEKQLGIKVGEYLNKAQLEERHPRLKNAPVEGGAYTADIPMKHKPFNDLIRNVKCVRCGEWGHVRGDRECSLLHELSAIDLARQRQEDPLNAMRRDELLGEKQKLIFCKAVQSKGAYANRNPGVLSNALAANDQLLESDEDGESDPEGDFLATLTRREKKLLMRKLQKMQKSEDISVGALASSSSSSSSSSSPCSSKSSRSCRRRRRSSKYSHSDNNAKKKKRKRSDFSDDSSGHRNKPKSKQR